MTLAETVYALARQMEPHDRFVLGSQLAAHGSVVPSNIAEGWGRGAGRMLRGMLASTLRRAKPDS